MSAEEHLLLSGLSSVAVQSPEPSRKPRASGQTGTTENHVADVFVKAATLHIKAAAHQSCYTS